MEITQSLKPSEEQVWNNYYSKEVLDFKVPSKTIYDCIFDNNKKYQNRAALEYFGRKISYNELFENVTNTAKTLKFIGIKKGDIITICMPTTPETVYLFYALSRIGAIANMIDPRTSEDGIKEYIEEANSKYLFILDSFYSKAERLEGLNDKIVISPSDSLPFGTNYIYKSSVLFQKDVNMAKKDVRNKKILNWNRFIKLGESYEAIIDEPYEKNRPVAIVHTGGTTGKPKGVLISNDALNAVAYQYKLSGMHLIPGHRFMNIMPPFIAYGIGCGIHMPLVIGMTSLCVPSFDPKKLDKLILKLKPNHNAGVPSHWENIINSKRFKNKDLSFWITPAVGGDGMKIKLEEESNEFLQEHNAPNNIIKGYGITEECSLATACINEHNKIGSVGYALPKNMVCIFEPDTDKELDYNEVGEICITGPSLMLEYYNNPEETDKIIKTHSDGRKWIHTQDLGYIDKEGYIFVKGRIKRVIIRHDGFKVFPFIIEKVIMENPAVKDCTVVGAPDVDHVQGFVPEANIILNDDYKNTGMEADIIASIKALCEQKLAEYVVPTYYQIKNEFPLTPIGKVDYRVLEKEVADKINNQLILKKIKN